MGGQKGQNAGQASTRVGGGGCAPCADCGSATVPPAGGIFPLSHSASPPTISRASVVGGNKHSHPATYALPSTQEPHSPKGPAPSRFRDVQQRPRAAQLHCSPSPKRPHSTSLGATALLSPPFPQAPPTWRRASSTSLSDPANRPLPRTGASIPQVHQVQLSSPSVRCSPLTSPVPRGTEGQPPAPGPAAGSGCWLELAGTGSASAGR